MLLLSLVNVHSVHLAGLWFISIGLVGIVRQVGKGKYVVFSHKGKRLSKPASKAAAQKRLKQIEYFKRIH